MKKRLWIGATVTGLLLVTGGFLFRHHLARTQGSPGASASSAGHPAAGAAAGTNATPGASPVAPNLERPAPPAVTVRPLVIDLSAPVDPGHRAEVMTALTQLGGLYADAGTLNWEDTKALVARRRQAADTLADSLAQLGAGGARAIAQVYAQSADTRARLLMVTALGRIHDGEASAVLNALLEQEGSYSVRKEMVAALGKRPEADSGAALASLLQNQDDPRLRCASVQALSGRAEALPALAERIRTDASQDVRLEAVHVVGSIDHQAARDLLGDLARSSTQTELRQKAILELARSSGDGGFLVFQGLLSDPDEIIRQSAVKALTRLHSDRALALLQETAASDASTPIRELAKAAASTPAEARSE